ncbi:winged helix-turn-helix domain-containing protein [Pseudoalteromonas sp. S16_S37]|uniref:winged helix-turn-helix domain-containing protein n=1 Tax=Pseudoalteromonas sp. S16_S37 TaxID=2720228 RepID=UPI0016805F64|nr:winged helix-turn-helix domain-containing protein [Pseudoalteromonas sp. S16_S37]MBD1584729.1 hypothetical protein [Pseudoalteromonas sp. S16_S37]
MNEDETLPASNNTCVIYIQTGSVMMAGKSHTFRPKTFELLLLLAQNSDTVFSKEQILSSVWSDSVVEEQVVFQSINEIRKALGDSDIIKTYSRRGYQWNVTNTQFVDKLSPHLNMTPKKVYQISVFALSILILLPTLYFRYFDTSTTTDSASVTSSQSMSPKHSGILVLPFEVQSSGNGLGWLRYGAMEGLINQLSGHQQVTVFHVEDVIDILNRVPKGQSNKIESIFAKSGASYILETTITGQPGELNIIYTFYTRTARQTKTLHAQNLSDALPKLSRLFSHMKHQNALQSNLAIDTQLQNDLIAKAIRFLELDDLKSALTFINSALINAPDNIVALYFSSKINMELGNARQALSSSKHALSVIKPDTHSEYLPRLYYFHANALLATGQVNDAITALEKAQKQAKKQQDWLYYAYTQSVMGFVYMRQSQFAKARERFNAALEYQLLLQCPMGEAQGYLDLTELALAQGNQVEANSYFARAKALVEQRALNKVVPLLNQVQQQFHKGI